MYRICIVIPTSDSFVTLPVAVESALAQRHEDFHVYVSDNSSGDKTPEYLLSLRDKRITGVSHSERAGKTENWNRAFRTAPACEIFVMLHSDDILYPEALNEIDCAFRKWPSASLVYGNHDILSLDGTRIAKKRLWPMTYVSSGRRFDRLQMLLNSVSIVGCAFPSTLYERVGGFPKEYDFYQDMEFFRLLAKIGPAVYLPCKIGLNRGAPNRPRNRLRYYCEEITWLKQQTGVWPSILSKWIQITWAKNAYWHLSDEFPETLSEYCAHLTNLGMRIDDVTAKRVAIPKLFLHRVFKLWLSLLLACGISGEDRAS